MAFKSKYSGLEVDTLLDVVREVSAQNGAKASAIVWELIARPWRIIPGLSLDIRQFLTGAFPNGGAPSMDEFVDSSNGRCVFEPDGIQVDPEWVRALTCAPSVCVPARNQSTQMVPLTLHVVKELQEMKDTYNYSFASPIFADMETGDSSFTIWTFQVQNPTTTPTLLSITYDYFPGYEEARMTRDDFIDWANHSPVDSTVYGRTTEGYIPTSL